MRKFVIKNRQKRKYTKKTEDTSSFSFSKTAYGMVPLLVMFIAFMSTLFISTPFRDSLSNINFTFELPQFSFSNPLSFIQSIISDITQASFVVWTIILVVYTTFIQSLTIFLNMLIHEVLLFGNQIEFQRNATQSAITSKGQEFAIGISILEKILIMIVSYCEQTLLSITTVVTNFVTFIEQSISAMAIATIKTITFVTIYLSHIILFTSITAFNFIFMIGETIGMWFVSVGNYIVTTIEHIMLAVAHVVEIPFKVLYAFWLQIKPYIDFFGNHVQMTGSDFANGFTNFGKVISFMSHAK